MGNNICRVNCTTVVEAAECKETNKEKPKANQIKTKLKDYFELRVFHPLKKHLGAISRNSNSTSISYPKKKAPTLKEKHIEITIPKS